jgi:hypothetical protein
MAKSDYYYPVDIVLAPEWWHSETGITFDEDFFYHPGRRVEAEQRMEKELYDRWGDYGFGAGRNTSRPDVGAVHLAAGFFLSEVLGCEVEYSDGHPPRVKPQKLSKPVLSVEDFTFHPRFRQFESMVEQLKSRYGYVSGDVNWGGVLNIALDLRGESLFLDAVDLPEELDLFFGQISRVIEQFVSYIERMSGTTSISVNRTISGVDKKIRLHSECSHTMISEEFYREHLMRFDIAWSQAEGPYGIHYCGKDPHRFAQVFAELPSLDFLDVGWGGDIAVLRKALPRTFLNIRLDPVSLVHKSPAEIEKLVVDLADEAGDPLLTGFCCINIDDSMPEKNTTAVFRAINELRHKAEVLQN